ncbi:MAG: acyltransferase family protein [Alphaproteobacteria bacterium]
MKYRTDIDGLRALAVLPVVLFHAGFDVFSGGFVGVDIFFVISGFLITSIIINDLNQERFSIREFYERRIRRILPALYTVCFVTLIAGCLVFLPAELESLGRGLGTTLLFVSNILFWSETGYFDASADLKPLLHTWSLAVEEQFYVFFPLLLILIAKFLKKKYVPVLLICAFGSFAISVWGAEYKPSATFYWAPTRAWELLLGAFLALGFIPLPSRRWLLEVLGILGLCLIGYAVFAFDYDTAFPGLNALFPCLGASLLIYANQSRQTVSKKFLGLKPLVFIGLCSYSFYLWHWPVFVFAKYLSMNSLTGVQSCGLVLLSFALSVMTWKFIETPFRNRSFLAGRWKVFTVALLASIPLFAASGAIIGKEGFPNRFANIEALEKQKESHVKEACVDIASSEFEKQKCVFGNQSKAPSFIVWGDSHAGAFMPAFDTIGKETGRAGILASSSGCPPLLEITLARDEKPHKCIEFNNTILSTIKDGDTVFLVARWTYYTHKSLINHEGPTWLNNEFSREISEKENLRVFEDALKSTIKAIKERGAVPVIVDSVPEYPRSVPEMLFLFDRDVTVSKELFNNNRQKTSDILRNISSQNEAEYIDPSRILCDESKCYANKEQSVFYFDDDHLSLDGAEKIESMLKSYLK